MSNPSDGIIKFNYACDNHNYIIPQSVYACLNPVRNFLHNKGYIGVYSNGISYGNISIRSNNSHFFITASNTGFLKQTLKKHYVKVTKCAPEENLLVYEGSGLPSSESLSHYIIYKESPTINAVIHIHDKLLWHKLKDTLPTSSPHITYGSLEMVYEIKQLFKSTNLAREKILVMGGHEDGIIVFGEDINEALGKINEFLSNF